jgi:hypothetical protein
MDKYAEQLTLEAVTVGGLFIPWSYIVSGIIYRLPVPQGSKSALTVFAAGASFHLVAEFSGLNDYYLKNSAAHTLSMRNWVASCKSKQENRERPCGIRLQFSQHYS